MSKEVTRTSKKRLSADELTALIQFCERFEIVMLLPALYELSNFRAFTQPTHEPPVEPVAWRKALDPQYDYSDRYRYRDATSIGAPEGWEPLYAAPASPPTKRNAP